MANGKSSLLVPFAPHAAKVREHNPSISRLKSDPDVQLGMAAARARISFANMAREMRRKAGLTQAEVAELLDTTQKQISRMESCTASAGDITVGMFAKFMQACGAELVIEVSDAEVKVSNQKPRSKVVDLAEASA